MLLWVTCGYVELTRCTSPQQCAGWQCRPRLGLATGTDPPPEHRIYHGIQTGYIHIRIRWDHPFGRIRLDRSPHRCIRIRDGPWLGWYLLIALIPPLLWYPMWDARPALDKASVIMHICSAIGDIGPQGPKPKSCWAGALDCLVGYQVKDWITIIRATSKYHLSHSPYRILATVGFVAT